MNPSSKHPLKIADKHCTRVEAGTHWPDPKARETKHVASGQAMDTAFQVFTEGDSIVFESHRLGEELGAILEGQFEIDAAGEHYLLSCGEAILIPPQEARQYRCLSTRGVLYRVTVRIGQETIADAAGTTESGGAVA